MDINNFFLFFSDLTDYRVKGRTKYPLSFILLCVLFSLIAQKSSWHGISMYVQRYIKEINDLHKELTNTDEEYDVPTHDTMSRVIGMLDPKEFNNAFHDWVISVIKTVSGKHICIDGKTFRGVKKRTFDSESHVVNAYSPADRITIAQTYVNSKEGELNGIYSLLELLTLEDATVTIDALGAQVKIAQMIIDKGGDYILQIKSNQKNSLLQINKIFETLDSNHPAFFHHEPISNLAHGRIEKYDYSIVDISKLDSDLVTEDISKWKGILTILKTVRTVEVKKTGKITTEKPRYYISTLTDSDKLISYSKGHWSIENNLHRALDVNFKQDYSSKYHANIAANFDMMLKVVLHLIADISENSKIGGIMRVQDYMNNCRPDEIISLIQSKKSV